MATKLEPCPFCGNGELIITETGGPYGGGGMIHTEPRCETFDECNSLGEIADELEKLRKYGYRHGVPKTTRCEDPTFIFDEKGPQ